MRTLCIASFCILALATSSFATTVTVVDSTAALPGVAAATAALLLDAGLPVHNAGGGKRTVEAKKFHCDERNNGALDPSNVHAGLETLTCRINSKNQKGTTAGQPFGDRRALRDLLVQIQEFERRRRHDVQRLRHRILRRIRQIHHLHDRHRHPGLRHRRALVLHLCGRAMSGPRVR